MDMFISTTILARRLAFSAALLLACLACDSETDPTTSGESTTGLGGATEEQPTTCEGVIVFPDHWLDWDIRELGGIAKEQDIYHADLLDITFTDDSDEAGISDLAGLECVSNMESLNLHDNDIVDIGPIRWLVHLSTLNLNDNEIVDIGPLVANHGIDEGDNVGLSSNPIDCEAQADNIQALLDRGVLLTIDCEL